MLLYEAPNSARPPRTFTACSKHRAKLSRGGSRAKTIQLLEVELDRASALSTTRPMRSRSRRVNSVYAASKSDAFSFFRQLVNYDSVAVNATDARHAPDYFLSDSAIECYRDHLLVGDRLVRRSR